MSALERLALRALGRLGGVRPRLGARFEGGADFGDAIDEPIAPRKPSATIRQGAPAEAAPLGCAVGPAVDPVPTAFAPIAPTPASGFTPAPAAAATNVASAQRKPTEVAASPAPSGMRAVWEATPRPAAPTADLHRVAHDVAEHSRTLAADRFVPLLPPFRSASEAGLHEPVDAARPGAGPEAPEIRISIGRIEVRAPRPEPARNFQAPRAKPQLMSLEDYLGGRRSR